MNFYISDLHFDHDNIIAYDNRPYFNVEEMNNDLIKGWNSVVGKKDNGFIMGDISWANKTKTMEYLNKLNGNKFLIRGNHDENFKCCENDNGFIWIKDYAEIKDEGRNIVLSHYPIPIYKNLYRGWYHLYGHTHSTEDDVLTESFVKSVFSYYELERRAFNIGCMKWWINYIPKTLDQIIELHKKHEEFVKINDK